MFYRVLFLENTTKFTSSEYEYEKLLELIEKECKYNTIEIYWLCARI